MHRPPTQRNENTMLKTLVNNTIKIVFLFDVRNVPMEQIVFFFVCESIPSINVNCWFTFPIFFFSLILIVFGNLVSIYYNSCVQLQSIHTYKLRALAQNKRKFNLDFAIISGSLSFSTSTSFPLEWTLCVWACYVHLYIHVERHSKAYPHNFMWLRQHWHTYYILYI